MKKITKREFKKFVVPKMHSENFTKMQREAVKSAFFSDLQDKEYGGSSGLFGSPSPGISEEELEQKLEELRDPSSPLSKGLKYSFHKHPEKIDKLEEIMREAIDGDKGGWF